MPFGLFSTSPYRALVSFHVVHVQIAHRAAELFNRSVDMAVGGVTPADGARVVFLTADIGAGAL
jgi:hypothetical protein